MQRSPISESPGVDMARELNPKTPQSGSAPKADRYTLTIPTIRPSALIMQIIDPDPGAKLMAATEALAAEVLPAVQADHHLKQMLLRIRHLIEEGEGWAAMEERRLINGQVCMIVTDYFRRKKVRRVRVEARHHVDARRLTVFLSVIHGRSEATRILEITPQ